MTAPATKPRASIPSIGQGRGDEPSGSVTMFRKAASFHFFGHDRGHRFRYGYGSSYYDYGCSYGYPYYNRYSCYTPGYY